MACSRKLPGQHRPLNLDLPSDLGRFTTLAASSPTIAWIESCFRTGNEGGQPFQAALIFSVAITRKL